MNLFTGCEAGHHCIPLDDCPYFKELKRNLTSSPLPERRTLENEYYEIWVAGVIHELQCGNEDEDTLIYNNHCCLTPPPPSKYLVHMISRVSNSPIYVHIARDATFLARCHEESACERSKCTIQESTVCGERGHPDCSLDYFDESTCHLLSIVDFNVVTCITCSNSSLSYDYYT